MSGEQPGESEMQDLARRIPWNDEPMSDRELLVLRRAGLMVGGYAMRAAQEIDRLRQQVGTLRQDRRDNYTEIAQLRAGLEDYRKRVTMGGPTVPVDTGWGNVTLPPPASASDETAPPIRTGRGSDRLANPDPARRLEPEVESQSIAQALTEEAADA